jgi:hypothetical protein
VARILAALFVAIAVAIGYGPLGGWMDLYTLIPASYAVSRERFRASLDSILAYRTSAAVDAYALRENPTLTTDWITAHAESRRERLFVLTTAEHGIEGYVGSAVMQLFCAEFLPRLDTSTAGVLLVHALNPWGMEHRTRVNCHNVDLNRSFLERPEAFDPSFNPDYLPLRKLLAPQGPLQVQGRAAASFSLRLMRTLASHGSGKIQRATLMGQYVDPLGVYFGGNGPQEEGVHLRELVLQATEGYRQVTWVDIHTGYGPSDRMTLVLSAAEAAPTESLRTRLGYGTLAKADGGEFYAMRGDMVDHFYSVFSAERPATKFFALAFEFGTFGDGLMARLRGLRATVLENQLRHHGAVSPRAEAWARREFSDLFLPHAASWYAKAEADARQAFAGILGGAGFLVGS